jgi:hypothetical protein
MEVDSSQTATALLTEHLQYTPLVSQHPAEPWHYCLSVVVLRVLIEIVPH